MPQGKTEIKKDGGRGKMVNIRKKFKIGGRGSTLSATQLSNTNLLERLTSNTTSGSDCQKIRQVLAKRNVTV